MFCFDSIKRNYAFPSDLILDWHFMLLFLSVWSQFSSLSRVRLFATTWTAVRQASLSITNSWSLLKLLSNESVMPSNHLILCHPLLLLPSTFPSSKVFSNESVLQCDLSDPKTSVIPSMTLKFWYRHDSSS